MERRTQRLVDGWLATHPSPNTQAAYRHDLVRFLDWCASTNRRPLSATPADIDTYRDGCLAAGAAAATVARRLSGISSFYRYAAAAGAVRVDPVEGVDRPAAPDPAESPVLDPGELDALLSSARDVGSKAAALVALLAFDGLKLNETLAMDVGDLWLAHGAGSVAVTRQGDRRDVSLSAVTSNVLHAYIGTRQSGPLFLGESPVAQAPSRLTRFGADFILKRAGSAAGLDKPVSANVLRRSYIAAAHRAGSPLEDITRQVGHREVRATGRFVKG